MTRQDFTPNPDLWVLNLEGARTRFAAVWDAIDHLANAIRDENRRPDLLAEVDMLIDEGRNSFQGLPNPVELDVKSHSATGGPELGVRFGLDGLDLPRQCVVHNVFPSPGLEAESQASGTSVGEAVDSSGEAGPFAPRRAVDETVEVAS